MRTIESDINEENERNYKKTISKQHQVTTTKIEANNILGNNNIFGYSNIEKNSKVKQIHPKNIHFVEYMAYSLKNMAKKGIHI